MPARPKSFPSPRRFAACALVAALLFTAQHSSAENEPLPELGDSASQILSPIQEENIGQQFLRNLLHNQDYVDDPELNHYLHQLAQKIIATADANKTKIFAHMLRHPDLNAFAVPGGHITFHTGLLLSAGDEDELASVMAHEIAHITQRHLPRMLAKSEAGKLPAAAAILASLLVGGKAGLAGFTVANAALLSNQLAYTREFEREADSIGIKLLAAADYDPTAMVRFFGRLERHSGFGEESPEFLRTHPLSHARIAEAENRAAGFTPTPSPPRRAFHLAKAKVRALFSPELRDTIPYFQNRVLETSGELKNAAIYGLALTQKKMRRTDDARKTLQPLLTKYPKEVAFQIARAEIDIIDGKPAAAAERYNKLVADNPEMLYLVSYQARALIAAGDAATAKRVVRHQLRRHKERFILYPLLSESNAKLGSLAEAHQATAEYHAALDDYDSAVASLKQALRESDSEEGYLHQSISARLAELEAVLEKNF